MSSCTKIFLLVLFEIQRNFYHIQSCRRGISSESGIEFHSFVYKSIAGVDLQTCVVNCIQDEICQSINFDTALFHCQFNNEKKGCKPNNVRPKEHSVYMENIAKAKIGSNANVAGHSCKEINDLGDSRGDGEYWIDPGNTGQPFTVYCDMTTDSGGWTLLKKANLPTTSPAALIRRNSYRYLSNYKDYRDIIGVSKLSELKSDMGFQELRFRCRKKSINRTIHIMTTNNPAGHKVVDHFFVNASWPTACNSFERLPDDTSILSQNCLKWGHIGKQTEVNRWGSYKYDSNHRLYSGPILWEYKYYFSCLRPDYYCDDFTGDTYGPLSVGDIWEIFVR